MGFTVSNEAIKVKEVLINPEQNEKLKQIRKLSVPENKKMEVDESKIEIETKDLVKYGLKPELVRRFPVRKVARELKKPQLKEIAKKFKNI